MIHDNSKSQMLLQGVSNVLLASLKDMEEMKYFPPNKKGHDTLRKQKHINLI